MSDSPSPKESSIQALRNSTKHLNELYRQIDVANTVMSKAKSNIEHLQKQCGNLYIQVYVNGSYKQVKLSTYLNDIAVLLTNGAIRA